MLFDYYRNKPFVMVANLFSALPFVYRISLQYVLMEFLNFESIFHRNSLWNKKVTITLSLLL